MVKVPTRRLEAFSDGVISIIITIMVLNIPLPHEFTFKAVMGFLSSILIFFVSFFVVGAQWHKHQHMFHQFTEVSNKVLWRNILHLFFLSLMPLFTKWIMQNPDEVIPAVGYNMVFLLVNLSNQFLFGSIIKENKEHETVKEIEKFRTENKVSKLHFAMMFATITGIFILSFFYPRISIIFFIGFPVASSLFNLVFENRRNGSI